MIAIIDSPIGHLRIVSSGDAITQIELTDDACVLTTTPLLKACSQELCDYFEGTLTQFSVPTKTCGTEFQEAVWHAMRQIPYGDTQSYQDIAIAIGNPKAVRAVGGACNKNPLLIMNPCHRIVSKHNIGGFAHDILIKKLLLDNERR